MESDTPQRRLLTVPEAAAELGVSRVWAARHLPVIRLGEGAKRGSVMRVDRADLDSFVEKRRLLVGGR